MKTSEDTFSHLSKWVFSAFRIFQIPSLGKGVDYPTHAKLLNERLLGQEKAHVYNRVLVTIS